MGKPAARLKDKHVCPIHGGGPILSPGFPTVRIGGQPAARAGDLATCVGGPPDMILAGSATVFIGGLPAARMGDPAVHGGKIVEGCLSVEIGG
jgi:uncharacterized Zn-binding protein involved in type VI secretion